MEIDFKVGGKYRMQYKKDPEVTGEFLEIIPDKKVVFSWSEMNTKVTVLIEPKGNSSLLKLTHELIPDAQWYERFNGGWTYCYNNLEKELTK